MNARHRTFALAMILGIAQAVSAASSTNALPGDLDKPIRIVNKQRVNLKPLADWYKDLAAGANVSDLDRPLSAWKLVRIDRIVSSNLAWKVEATVDGERQTLILKNPPRREADQFNQLKLVKAQLLVRTNQLQLELRRVDAARRQAVNQELALRWRPMGKWGPVAAAQQRSEMLGAQQYALSQDLEAARYQLQQIESLDIDFRKPLKLEYFALKTGETLQGKPVYDRGQVSAF